MHRCHAIDCQTIVQPRLLMCRFHWFMVPVTIRRRITMAYRPAQCDDKRPSAAWMKAAKEAIASVADQEGRLFQGLTA